MPKIRKFLKKDDKNMEKTEINEYLPLGSIVVLKGGLIKLMIVSRAMYVKNAEERKYFDYAACIYPVGITDDKLMYFNAGDIMKVISLGYSNEDDKIMIENIKTAKNTIK